MESTLTLKQPSKPFVPPDMALFLLLWAVLVVLEGVSVWLVYDNVSAVAQGLYLLIVLAAALVCLAVSVKSRLWAGLLAIAVALLIVPMQFNLFYRYHRIQSEVALIAGYAYAEKAETGSYPTDLSGYAYADPRIAPYVQSYWVADEGDDFKVYFYVSSPNASHWYASDTGWGYYPD